MLLTNLSQKWTERYQPKRSSEIISNKEAILSVKKFVLEKRPAILYGPPGVGKTSAAYALARDLDYEILEINASDKRNKEQILQIIGASAKQQSLFNKNKIILIDEIDGIAGNEDRGGVSALNEILKETKHAIIMTANDPFSQKLVELRKKCCLVEFKPVSTEEIFFTLKKILEKENITYDESILRKLARKSNGDLRAAINDAQTLSQGKKALLEVDTVEERQKQETIFTALKTIFKSEDLNLILESFDNTNIELDECFLWLDENIPLEYKKPEELKRAYEALSKSDIYKKRIFHNQYYRLLVYRKALMTAGIAFSKKQKYMGFSPYKRTTRILKMWIQKQKNLKKVVIAEKLAHYTHCSVKKTLGNSMSLLKTLVNKKIIPPELNLSEEEIDYIKKL
ncbi:replication factor C large subunit [Candidatus Woesearchaeota archaeon]|nr:replication factor C large subunit [Candidatus Woesearchaeota archaeon]